MTKGGDAPPLEEMAHPDWAAFMRIGQAHGLLPIAWTALRPFADAVGDAAEAELRLVYEANARRNLVMLGELRTIVAALGEHGIRAVSWKGPVLAQRAYDDLAARQFFDLDLLVRRADLAAALPVVQKLGFRPERSMSDHEQETYVDHQGELELVRTSDGLWIEIHSAVMPGYYGRGLSSDAWWQRVVDVDVGRVRIPALDPVDELQSLCVHGSKHRWDRLAWILDVAMLGRTLDTAQWSELHVAATGQGTLRMVWLGLLLAADLCAAPMPEEVLRAARGDRVAAALATSVAQTIFDQRPSRFDALLFHARMRERGRDQARYLLNVAFTPSGADWGTLHLPAVLFPLYAVTRPVRLAVKYGRRLVAPPRG